MKKSFSESVGAAIDSMIGSKHVKLSDLSKLTGISPATLTRRRYDPSGYRLEELELIAKALKIQLPRWEVSITQEE